MYSILPFMEQTNLLYKYVQSEVGARQAHQMQGHGIAHTDGERALHGEQELVVQR